jgi:excisionase family DNA binding protein
MRAEGKHPPSAGHEAAGRRSGTGPAPNAGSYDPAEPAGRDQAAGSSDPATPSRREWAAGSYDPAPPPGRDREVAGDLAATDDVLNVTGASQLLRIGRNTIYELVGRNQIPHRRLGKHIRFSRAAIMRWLDRWSLQSAKEGQ